MENWHFELFGGVRARRGSLVLDELAGRKTGALLALLALAPGRLRPREEVIDLIWPEIDFDDARNRFKQTLAVLRKQLEPVGTAPGSVLIADRLQVGLASSVQVDVVAFQEALRRAASAKDSLAQAGHLDSALELYQGELAPGFYLDALLSERERLAALVEGARERRRALALQEPETPPLREPQSTQQRPPNAFFGRQRERDEVGLLLQSHRLVTLLGPGGTGKTRLAQELPQVRFISLSSLRDGARLHDTLVAALELPPSNEPALTRLAAALESQTLALDNFEQLVATGGPEAVGALLHAAPSLRLVVTSRLKLDLAAEQVFPLAPLDTDNAVALFCDRARLVRPDFALTNENQATVSELCRRLDGLPLALELAAARMAILTPTQILERLARRFDLLADKRRDREERHTSLRAALDWGWSLLAPDVQRFFTSLCVFRGSFSLEAAETVTGELLAIDYLQSLADASFLVIEGERFRLLETLREYGRERLSDTENETLQRAHYDFYLACATQWQPLLHGESASMAMGHFKQDHDNLLAALERSLVAAPHDATRLALKLFHFWHFAYERSLAVDFLVRTLTAAQRAHLPEDQFVDLYHALGAAHQTLRHYSEARRYYQTYYELIGAQLTRREAEGEPAESLLPLRQTVAKVLNNLGSLYVGESQFEKALVYYEEAGQLMVAAGNLLARAHNLCGLFAATASLGFALTDPKERHHTLEKAQGFALAGTELSRQLKQDFLLCFLLLAQASVLPLLGKHEQAKPVLQEAFLLSCSLEHWEIFVDCLTYYTYQAIHDQCWEEAAQLQGAEAGNRQRHQAGSSKSDQHLRPSANLPERLGQERYEALYQAGFHAPLDSLKALVATLPHASPFEK